MSNIQNYNFNNVDAFLSNNHYHDYYLSNDGQVNFTHNHNILNNPCLVLHFDFNEENIYDYTSGSIGETIKSLSTWDEAVNDGPSLNTIGLTGIDNGLIKFNKLPSDTTNEALLTALTGSTLTLDDSDTRFTFNTVTGMTGNIVYPKAIIEDPNIGDYSTFCGGFYQGYFKLDGYNYEVLPTRHNKAWVSEFWINRDDATCLGVTGSTLNDLYPNNKGFFFYMGTRAENKFWNFFDGNNTGCTINCESDSGCTDNVSEFCTIPKETEISISGDTKFPITLHPPTYTIEHIDNNFLIYGRATKNENTRCGFDDMLGTEDTCSYSGGGITVTASTFNMTYETNPFLIYGRATKNEYTRCGFDDDYGKEDTCSYTGQTSDYDLSLDVNADVIDNAIGFRIKDDGSIGYRLLTESCVNGTTEVVIKEEYSKPGLIKESGWEHIAIRFVMPDYYDKCDLEVKDPRVGRLMFYVNGMLRFVAEDVPEVVLRRLDEYKDKQLGVPFNYSLGGGSQGLLESMTFDGQDPDDLGLHIEKNFAGTFIGSISQFKFYNCDLDWCDIQHNFKSEINRYKIN